MQTRFSLSASIFIGVYLAGGGAIAFAGMLIINPIPPPLRIAAAAVVAAYFAAAVARHALLRGKNAVHTIIVAGDEWEIHSPRQARRGRVRHKFISPWLTVFTVVAERRQWPVMVAADSMPPDAFRRLRVRLHCAGRRSAV